MYIKRFAKDIFDIKEIDAKINDWVKNGRILERKERTILNISYSVYDSSEYALVMYEED